MGNAKVSIRGKRKQIDGRDRVRVPDDLAGLQIPPRVGRAEAQTHPHYGQHDQERNTGGRTREDTS